MYYAYFLYFFVFPNDSFSKNKIKYKPMRHCHLHKIPSNELTLLPWSPSGLYTHSNTQNNNTYWNTRHYTTILHTHSRCCLLTFSIQYILFVIYTHADTMVEWEKKAPSFDCSSVGWFSDISSIRFNFLHCNPISRFSLPQ